MTKGKYPSSARKQRSIPSNSVDLIIADLRSSRSRPQCEWTDNPFNPFIEDVKRGYPRLCQSPATHTVVLTWTKGISAGDTDFYRCCKEHYQEILRRKRSWEGQAA